MELEIALSPDLLKQVGAWRVILDGKDFGPAIVRIENGVTILASRPFDRSVKRTGTFVGLPGPQASAAFKTDPLRINFDANNT